MQKKEDEVQNDQIFNNDDSKKIYNQIEDIEQIFVNPAEHLRKSFVVKKEENKNGFVNQKTS